MDEEAAMVWQDVLDQVAAGREQNLRCPFCSKGEIPSIATSQTPSPRVSRLPAVHRGTLEHNAQLARGSWLVTFSARVGSTPSKSIAPAASPCRSSTRSIRQSILIILGTAPGERVMRPHFGCEIHDLVYAPEQPQHRQPGRALLHRGARQVGAAHRRGRGRGRAVARRAQPPRHHHQVQGPRDQQLAQPGLPVLSPSGATTDMIPAPKLDDRTYADIVAEAMRLIPRYCPEWTNHNPSDPGITILELTAWMTELILYRLNRVPEKNYLAFLNMIGIRLRSPQPARALITFDLVEGAERQVDQGGHAGRDPAGGRRRHHHLRDAAGAGRRRRAARSLLLATSTRPTPTTRRSSPARGPRASRRSPAPIASIASCTSAIARFKARHRLVGAAAHHHRARSRRPRSGAPARVGILERPSLARAAHDAGRGRARRGRLLRPAGHGGDAGARHRGLSGCAAAWPRCRRTRGRPRSTPPRRSSRPSAKASFPTSRSPTSTAACSSRSTSARTSYPLGTAAEDRSVPLPRLARDAVAAGRRGAHRDRALRSRR